jgi:hypothetical protein
MEENLDNLSKDRWYVFARDLIVESNKLLDQIKTADKFEFVLLSPV